MENISEYVRNTATNMHELLMQIAGHIEKLELENSELRKKLEATTDDFK